MFFDTRKNDVKIYEFDNKISLSRKCSITDKIYTVCVSQNDYYRWKNGEFIQDVFPYLSADDREFIMTGITPTEWDDMFKEEDK